MAIKVIDSIYIDANPIAVKKALQLMGVIESAELRLPLVELDAEKTKQLAAVLKAYKLI